MSSDVLHSDPEWFRRFIRTHPITHSITELDWLPFVLLSLASCALIAATPPTPKWQLIRASTVPIVASYQIYIILFTIENTWETHWTNITAMILHFTRALELMVFYPAEENCYRVRPRSGWEGQVETKEKGVKPDDLVAEEVPEPMTMAKMYWALDVWYSQRGIGWNYAAPLPDSSRVDPFIQGSSRMAWFVNRARYLAILALVGDIARTYMTFGPGADFFEGRPGSAPSYDSLTIVQRALYSVPVAVRVVWSIDKWSQSLAIGAVLIGAITGWTGPWWTPEGWPPLFGSLTELWSHPGVSHIWSKTWHQYFHHWLYIFGWIGIGENLLRLPRSGRPARPHPTSKSLKPIAHMVRDKSPTKVDPNNLPPMPTPTPARPFPLERIPSARRIAPKYMLSNFVKSIIVFTLTGLYHDLPSYLLLLRTSSPLSPITISDCFPTTMFFILQPFALGVETYFKKQWRHIKARIHPGWAKGGKEPAWLVTAERIIGFVWTWWWLGYTARYFVVGLTKSGMYLRKEGQPLHFSPVGGLVYGKWYH